MESTTERLRRQLTVGAVNDRWIVFVCWVSTL